MKTRTKVLSGVLAGVILGSLHLLIPQKNIREVPHVRLSNYALNHKAIERARSFTVLISNEGFGGVARGTGILIDETHVLTCAHMVESKSDDIWVFPYPVHTVFKATPVYGDRRHDLAILELNQPVTLPYYAVFSSSYTIGEPITIIGNTLGCMQWFTSYGLISGAKAFYLLTDGLVRGGNSGGPWINDAGEVVALTDWGLQNRKGQNIEISGGVNAAAIQIFINGWKMFEVSTSG